MRIVTVRRITQVFFLLLFIWFCVVTTIGVAWWQLRGWPVNWLLQLDPLVAVATMLSTQSLYWGLLWALVTVVLTIILGRFFCSWVCPFGTIHHFIGYLARRGKSVSARIALNKFHPAQHIKYYLLIFLLTAAAGSLLSNLLRVVPEKPVLFSAVVIFSLLGLAMLSLLRVIPDPKKALVTLLFLIGLWLGLGLLVPAAGLVAASLQTGLLDPIPLVHRSINLTLLPLAERISTSQRYYFGSWFIGAVFLTALLLNLRVPRFYCRFLCPLGALFGVLGAFSLWRIGAAESSTECSQCHLCDTDCEGACQPAENIRISECILCMNCMDSCPHNLVGYRTTTSEAGEIALPDLSRRVFLTSLVSGTVAIPIVRLEGLVGPNWQPSVIRPPGALAEPEFLGRCLKCGQCMRICPTNIIHPASLDSGLEGLWSPVLNFRIGTSGCQLNCIACSHICPTAAIRPISLDEKLGKGQFAQAGPIRMGTAFVDRGRCLPWAMDRPCIVCEENCPVSPKAIFTREYFSTVRGGAYRVLNIAGETLELGGPDLPQGQLATGDYYVMTTHGEKKHRWRIAQNTSTSVTVAASESLHAAPELESYISIQVKLQRPYVDPKLCIGCGICEHECPVSGKRAIRVTAENETRSPERSLLVRRS
ncbi:MAG: 4Fe-4S binding protein [Deltaproteobacteria bacterium]|nr:MAG: 4Fe-4S binding protein [Deltaproteobacteria bacterium]